MKRKVKYLSAIILLLSSILALLIKINYPIKVSTTESIFHMIPIYYWILLITIPILICITFILTECKSVCVFLAIIYFFVLYSFFLFSVIPPVGGDMPEGGHRFLLLKESTSLSIDQLNPFQWPIHYLFYMVSIKILDVGISVLTLLLFSFILMIPLLLSLFVNEPSNKKVYFLLPIGYIILSYYFINLQWVPQFTGLIFLILTIGSYSKFKKKPSRKFYALTIFFYIICVFTHAFIFIFFPIAIFLDRYLLPKKIFFSEDEDNNKISLISLLCIYFVGYLYRFLGMGFYTRKLIYPRNGRGEAWRIIGILLRDFEGVGTRDYSTYPLYRLVSEEILLVSSYATRIFLIIFLLLLGYILLINIRKIKSFEISLGISGGGFFLLGLIQPEILGQRAFQIIFLKFPRYFSDLMGSKNKILVFILVIAIAIAPVLITTNRVINNSLSGGSHFQDDTSLNSGRFVVDYGNNESNILIPGFSFFPGRGDNIYRTRSIPQEKINITEIDIIIDSPKQTNRMEFYDLDSDFCKTSRIYDNGDSQVLLCQNE